MPQYYDIYALSEKRDKETIEVFLNHFCFRDEIENRKGEDIGIYANEKYNISELIIDINTLSEVIEYGIANPNHGFAFYIGDHLKENISHVILKFTYDGKIIFGLSINSKDDTSNDTYSTAERIVNEIASLINSVKTSIQFENPPADDEDEFDENMLLWNKVYNMV